VALVHTEQEYEECSRKRSRLSIVATRVLQGVERQEPHRATLGGEGHATEAHESFHGEDTSRSHKPRSQAPPFAGRLELGSPLAGNETTNPLLDE